MKTILCSLFLLATLTAIGQSQFEYTPSFSAVIARDVETSSKWYQSLLGLKVREQMKDEKAGYNIIILESPSFTLELLQLKSAINPKEGKTGEVLVQGPFKFGFNVNDMDACLKQLAKLNITVPQIYTDSKTKKRNFLITDPDGNLIQFFE